MGSGKGLSIWLVIAVMVCIVVVLGARLGYDTVDANHLGVKVRFGELLGTMHPGMEWTGLFVNVEQYDMRIRQASVDMLDEKSSATDKDGQAVFGSVSVNFRIKQDAQVVQKLYTNVGMDKEIDDKMNIIPIIKEGFKQATVEYEALEILQNRQKVKELAKENIKNNFPQEYFEIVDIVVEDLDFSPEFKKAIEEKKTATQLKLKEEEMVNVIRFQQEQEIEKYKAQAEQLRLQKQEVTALLNQQKMIDKWDGKLPQYLIITPESQGLFLDLAKGEIEGGLN